MPVDGSYVYWVAATGPGGSVMKWPLGGGRLIPIASRVYWTNGGDGTVMHVTPK